MRVLLNEYGMWDVIVRKVSDKSLQVFGTCAGAILCAGWGMGVEIDRNAYGAQQASFVGYLESENFFHLQGVFIRAPRFMAADVTCNVLAQFKDQPVLVEQSNFLAATFHPELTDDTRIHEYFLAKE